MKQENSDDACAAGEVWGDIQLLRRELRSMAHEELLQMDREHGWHTEALARTALGRVLKAGWGYDHNCKTRTQYLRKFRLYMKKALLDYYSSAIRRKPLAANNANEFARVLLKEAKDDRSRDPEASFWVMRVYDVMEARAPRSLDLLLERFLAGLSAEQLACDTGNSEQEMAERLLEALNEFKAASHQLFEEYQASLP